MGNICDKQANVNKKILLEDWCDLHREIQKKKKPSSQKRQEYKFYLLVNKLAQYIDYRTKYGKRSFIVRMSEIASLMDNLKDSDKKTSVSAIKNRLRVVKESGAINIRNFGRKGILIMINDYEKFSTWLKERIDYYYNLVPKTPKPRQKTSTYIDNYNINKYNNNNITNNVKINPQAVDKIKKGIYTAIKKNKTLSNLSQYAKKSAFNDMFKSFGDYSCIDNIYSWSFMLAKKYEKMGLRYGFDEKPNYHMSENHDKDNPEKSLDISRGVDMLVYDQIISDERYYERFEEDDLSKIMGKVKERLKKGGAAPCVNQDG